MNFGESIKELRLSNNLTQQKVADCLGISRSVLSQYENNLVDPTATVISKLAAYFDVSADYLLGLEDETGARTAAGVSPIGESMTARERELLELFRGLSHYLQDLTLDTVRNWANKPKSQLQDKV